MVGFIKRKFDATDVLRTAAVLVVGALLLGILALPGISDIQTSTEAWQLALVLGGVGYLLGGVGYAHILVSRSNEKTARAKASTNPAPPSYTMLFVGLFGALSILILGMSDLTDLGFSNNWPWSTDLETTLQKRVYFGFLGLSFVPLLYAFHLQERRIHANYLIHPGGPVSWQALVTTAVVVSAILLLAVLAGKGLLSLSPSFGLVVSGLVILLFLGFIAWPHIYSSALAEWRREENLNPPIMSAGIATVHPGAWVSAVDAALVRLVAPVSGVTQSGDYTPKILLGTLFGLLLVMGWQLPAPFGLVPLSIAGLLAVSLGRRWSWQEQDREKSMRIQSQERGRFGLGFGDDDLRDEALLGYLSLFVLVPLALRQIQLSTGLFEVSAGVDGSSLLDWFSFFGAELAKAVPIVDWIDIYDPAKSEAFIADNSNAKHVVFAARVIVDFVILAALFQAIGIMQRLSSQQKLFDEGQIDLLDPFLERRVFRQAYLGKNQDSYADVKVSTAFEARLLKHIENSKNVKRSGVPYSLDRLNELLLSSHAAERSVAQWIVERFDLLAGSVEHRMHTLNLRWEDASEEKWDEDIRWVNTQRIDFEQILSDARFVDSDYWSQKRSKLLSKLLSKVIRRGEFSSARALAYDVLGQSSSLHAAKALAARIVEPDAASNISSVSQSDIEDWSFAPQWKDGDRAVAMDAIGRLVGVINELDASKQETREFIRDVTVIALDSPGKKTQNAAKKVVTLLNSFRRDSSSS